MQGITIFGWERVPDSACERIFRKAGFGARWRDTPARATLPCLLHNNTLS